MDKGTQKMETNYTGGFNNGAFNGKGTFQSKEGWTTKAIL